MNILRSAEDVRASETNHKLAAQYEKDYYKKMRKNMMFKKRYPKMLKNEPEQNRYALVALNRQVADRHKSDSTVTYGVIQLTEVVPKINLISSNSCNSDTDNKVRKISFFEMEPIPEIQLQTKKSRRKASIIEYDCNFLNLFS